MLRLEHRSLILILILFLFLFLVLILIVNLAPFLIQDPGLPGRRTSSAEAPFRIRFVAWAQEAYPVARSGLSGRAIEPAAQIPAALRPRPVLGPPARYLQHPEQPVQWQPCEVQPEYYRAAPHNPAQTLIARQFFRAASRHLPQSPRQSGHRLPDDRSTRAWILQTHP